MNTATQQLNAVDAYGLWAHRYDEDPNPLLALEERIVTPLLPVLHNMMAADVACGTGRWLRHLLRKGAAAAAGLDLSAEMLRRAVGKHDIGARVVQADCTALPIQSGSVDLAMCSFGITYLPDLDRFAAELSRIVVEGGHLFVSDFHPSGKPRGWKRAFRHGDRVIEIATFDYAILDIGCALGNVGFRMERCVEACFGEQERSLFQEHGKGGVFDASCREPAIFVCHFTLGHA